MPIFDLDDATIWDIVVNKVSELLGHIESVLASGT
jgi:hypothetical protein